jgi:type VI secretion system FHA domain protein
MLLALSVVSEQGGTLGQAAYKIFDERGGSIGRITGNDWVLPDPQNFVSSRHARVSANAGVFFLEDTSSNGTFINAPDQLASRTEPQRLIDGDRLYIGDYEIIVQLIPSAPAELAARAPASTMSDEPTRLQVPAAARASLSSATAASSTVSSAGALPPMPPSSTLGLDTVDPLAALGGALPATPARAPVPASAAAADPLAALHSLNHPDPGTPASLTSFGIDVSRLDADAQSALLAGLHVSFGALLTKLHLQQLDADREAQLRQFFSEQFAQAFNEQLHKLAAAARQRGPR